MFKERLIFKSLLDYCFFIWSDLLYGFVVYKNSLYFYTKFYELSNVCYILKYCLLIGQSSLLDISVVDYPNRLNRFELNYVFLLYGIKVRFIIKTFVDKYTPIKSISNIFSSAGWLEREAWDMFGIRFLFHPDLRRILMITSL